ncbi:hypothetical protein MHK_007419 [Candidatus Magnetomorum sp. HK-1]|nr:hypothetical protein MHK_007419 [Candidatus Magnetomorum sp. HK-1]
MHVNTLYSCLATLSEKHSFKVFWKPSFISALTPEDRCHLNGLAVVKGKARYVTCVNRSDAVAGWRQRRSKGGCLIDISSDEIISENLSMPHSPRWYNDKLWLLNSAAGDFGYVDMKNGIFEPVTFCPGYMRGLAFHKNYAIIGLSKQRSRTVLSDLELDKRLEEKNTDSRCGLFIVDIHTGNVLHWLEFEGLISELYDVQILKNTSCPTLFTFFLSLDGIAPFRFGL